MKIGFGYGWLLVLLAACAAPGADPDRALSSPSPPPQVTSTVQASPSPQALPDLMVNTITIDQISCQVMVSVENVGTGDAAPFNVSMNGETQRLRAGLDAGKRVSMYFTANTITVLAAADPDNEINETDEDNNEGWQVVPLTSAAPPGPCDSAPASATPAFSAVDDRLPDLVIARSQAALEPGQTPDCWLPEQLGLLIHVANYGPVPVDRFEVAVDGQWQATIPGLGPNQTAALWFPVPLASRYELRIQVDSGQAIAERNEGNNWRTISGQHVATPEASPPCTSRPAP